MVSRYTFFAGAALLPMALCAEGVGAAPPPAAGPAGAPTVSTLSTDMPSPTSLAFATDQATCDKARAALQPPVDWCQILPKWGGGIFYWNWRGNAAHPNVVSFNVYRTDGGRHDLLRKTNPWTGGFAEGTTALFGGGLVSGECVTVTAADQTAESAPTPQLCITLPPPTAPPLSAIVLPLSGAGGSPSRPMAATRLPPPSRLRGLKPSVGAAVATDLKPTPCSSRSGAAGGPVCQAFLPKDALVIEWSYGPAQIGGFRVYSVPRIVGRQAPNRNFASPIAGAPVVATQTERLEGGHLETLVVVDPRAGAGSGCFVVTAFAGSEESEASERFCVAP